MALELIDQMRNWQLGDRIGMKKSRHYRSATSDRTDDANTGEDKRCNPGQRSSGGECYMRRNSTPEPTAEHRRRKAMMPRVK